MMDGIIGTVVSIVGVDMVNSNNRRNFKADEYDLYDVRKARPYWQEVCKTNQWQIIKDEEDFAEDFVCKIFDDIYFMELQVVGYWHNFDISNISNVWISASKVKNLKEKSDKAGLIFLNCVPNRFFGINVDQVKNEWQIKNIAEESYRIPLKEINFNQKVVFDRHLCDCLENHLEIMQRQNGRLALANKDFNKRGINGICC